ncbi:MAG TPA: hypothetical protein DD391_07455 [Clostridiales bacterium]|jgi:hypothetical protein|nr:hypothetical protein [Clostridiales bacterium]
MLQMKKLVSIVLSLSMLLSVSGAVFAEEPHTLQWDNTAVVSDAEHLFEEFPVQVDKIIDNAANMSISFHYLKTLPAGSEASVSVTDFSSGAEVFSSVFSASNHLVWENVEIDKTYGVVITEMAGGAASSYAAMLKTFNIAADFPVNFTLGDFPVYSEYNASPSKIMLREAGLVVECNHAETEECVPACSPSFYTQHIPQSQFNTFYETLPANKLYQIQTNAVVEGVQRNFNGFISTFENGEYLGVFTRSYGLYPMEMSELEARLTSGDVSSESDIQMAVSATDFENAVPYQYYENMYGSLSSSMPEVMIKWVVPETGYYTIETIGNVDTMVTSYAGPSSSGSTEREGGTGGNVKYQIQILEGVTRYFLVRRQSGSYGEIGFRIIRDEYTAGDQTNYRDVAQANYQSGNYDSNENPDACIDYAGDVDIYVFKTSTGNSHLEVLNTETALTLDVYTVEGTQGNGFDDLWKELSLCRTIEENTSITEVQTGYSSGFTYFEIRKQTIGDFPNDLFCYEFNFYPSNYKDEYDLAAHPTYGNSPVSPTNISIPESLNATLHKGDSDWYKFNSGTGGILEAEVTKTQEEQKQYNIHLYRASDIEIINTDPPEWYDAPSLGSITTTSLSKTLNYTLTPNTDYILKVTRPNNTTYSSHPDDYYTLNVNIAEPSTATLSGNVILSHTAGDNITSLDAFMNTIMESLTCKDGNTVIADSVAVNDVDLYYNNSLLTPAIVNGLSEGSYTIVAKYKGVAATGGNITLIIESEPEPGTVVEVNNITLETVTNTNWDWAACARMAANVRLLREGSSATTKTVGSAIIAIKTSAGINNRGTAAETAQAANYFYTNGSDMDSYNFLNDTVNPNTAEGVFLGQLQQGQTPIIVLTSAATSAEARYLLLCGVNTGNHTFKVIDPTTGSAAWVSQSQLFNGGYNGNNDLRFTGTVIEFA